MIVTKHAAERYCERVDSSLTAREAASRICGDVLPIVRMVGFDDFVGDSRAKLFFRGVAYVLALEEGGPVVVTCHTDPLARERAVAGRISRRNRADWRLRRRVIQGIQ